MEAVFLKQENNKESIRPGWFLFLHGALLIYSCCSLLSKQASRQAFLSLPFILFYGAMVLVLGIYAVLWQQVIKHMPITTAFANKAVTVVWGILLGRLVFGERITPRQALGAVIIIAGTILYVRSDLQGKEEGE